MADANFPSTNEQDFGRRLREEFPIVHSTPQHLSDIENAYRGLQAARLAEKAPGIQEEEADKLLRHKITDSYQSLIMIMTDVNFFNYPSFRQSLNQHVKVRKKQDRLIVSVKYADDCHSSWIYKSVIVDSRLKGHDLDIKVSMTDREEQQFNYMSLIMILGSAPLAYASPNRDSLLFISLAALSYAGMVKLGRRVSRSGEGNQKFDLKAMPQKLKDRDWQLEVLNQITNIPEYLNRAMQLNLERRSKKEGDLEKRILLLDGFCKNLAQVGRS